MVKKNSFHKHIDIFFGCLLFCTHKENHSLFEIMFLKCQIARYMNPKYTQMSYSSHSAMLGDGSHWLGQLDLRNKGQPRPGNKILWRRLKASRDSIHWSVLAASRRGWHPLVGASIHWLWLAASGWGWQALAGAGNHWQGL